MPAQFNKNHLFWQRLRRLLLCHSLAALVATGVDFAVVTCCVAWIHLTPPWATACGCGMGALVNFGINRIWTFKSQRQTLPQLWKYALVSWLGAVLNSLGVAVLLTCVAWDYRLIWLLVRLAVSWGWNLPLQRFFVFGSPA